MASVDWEFMGFFLGLLGALGTIMTAVLPFWHYHPSSRTVHGLWTQCSYNSSGIFHCQPFNSVTTSHMDLEISLGIMILALVISVAANATVLKGLFLPRLSRTRLIRIGGFLLITSGFVVLMSIGATIQKIFTTTNQHVSPSVRFELGECIYAGTASGLALLLAGTLLSVLRMMCPEAGVVGNKVILHTYRCPVLKRGGANAKSDRERLRAEP